MSIYKVLIMSALLLSASPVLYAGQDDAVVLQSPKGGFVGELQERWRFPSDHVPIGMVMDDVKIVSWNVLNDQYLGWIMEKDTQGLKRSLIGEEDVYIEGSKLTLRDQHVADLVLQMISNGSDVICLQECGEAFLEELSGRLPENFKMIVNGQESMLLNLRRFELVEVKEVVGVFTDQPERSLQDVMVKRLDNKEFLRLVNVHVPGDPTKPGLSDFAVYLQDTFNSDQASVVMGDFNFNEVEVLAAVTAPFTVYSPYCTNISPQGLRSKAIDHFLVYSPKKYHISLMEPDELLSNLELTVLLLEKK